MADLNMNDETNKVIAFPTNWMIASDFDPNDHLMNLKGRDYLNVQGRLLWFIRDQRALIAAGLAKVPFMAKTELVDIDRETGFAHFRSIVRDVLGNESIMYGSETAKDFTDYIEKASTKSLGRALLNLGYGTAFAPEMDEGERVVDAPVDHKATQRTQQRQNVAPVATQQRPVQPAQPAAQQRPVQPVQPVTPPAPRPAAPVAPVAPVNAPVVEAPLGPRVGMTPEESARFDKLIEQYPAKFVRWAIRESGYIPQPNDTRKQRDCMTEDQIATLFENVADWYSVWEFEQKAAQAAQTPQTSQTATPEVAEVPEAPVVAEMDEKARTKALMRMLVETYISDASGKPDATLMMAAYAYLLPKVPVPAGQPTMSHTELLVDGKTLSLSVVLRQHGVELKAYNDVLEVALGDAAFIDYITAQREKLGLMVDEAA